jgi:hypothetical protein
MLRVTKHYVIISIVISLLGACSASTPIVATLQSDPGATSTHAALTSLPTDIPTTAFVTATPIAMSATPTLPPTHTPLPTITTALPTETPWPTSTALPIPALVTHTWQANPVLIELGSTGGDGGPPYQARAYSVLYADGTFLISQRQGNHFEQMQSVLNRKQICAILYTIEQTGLSNLAARNWEANMYRADTDGYRIGEGSPAAIILARSWFSQTIFFPVLYQALEALKDEPEEIVSRYVPKAIRDVYTLLDTYKPAILKRYIPDQFMLIIEMRSDELPNKDTPLWPLPLRLSNLITPSPPSSDPYPYVPPVLQLIRGWEANRFYEKYYGNTDYPNDDLAFSENGMVYHVAIRALLPMETLHGRDNFEPLPSSDYRSHTISMSCYPSDGVLPIPDGK